MRNPYLVGFAAHVAHGLNREAEGGLARPQGYALWSEFMNLLAKPERPYRRQVVGAHLMGLDGDEEGRREAAGRWFDLVFDRPLLIRDGYPSHQAHHLMEALARRTPGVRKVELSRGPRPAEGPLPEALRHASDLFSGAAPAEEAGDDHESRLGPEGAPLWLQVDEGSFRLPLAFSIWGAVRHAPRALRLLPELAEEDPAPDERRMFSSLVIRAFEAANVHWGRAVALGISPWDHRGLATNQMVRLYGFVRRVGRSDALPPRATLEEAWAAAPVPRFADLDAFLASDVARDLFSSSSAPLLVWYDGDRDERIPEDPGPPDGEDRTGEVLEELFARGLIDETDRRIYLAVLKSPQDALKRIWRQEWARKTFPAFSDLLAHVDLLIGRVSGATARLRDEDSVSP
ncbi:hypothetical protein [Neomegalonema sp.]|uniref:hypothetical protein n=1 Tax=Neomegalonema sp. TaxID=2039713 RepID=UPI002608CA2E|nr:hypothetical protein [Neomegalonema sp.]MDD2870010.1 hypothetical protein [Neomegalonema sp.]